MIIVNLKKTMGDAIPCIILERRGILTKNDGTVIEVYDYDTGDYRTFEMTEEAGIYET